MLILITDIGPESSLFDEKERFINKLLFVEDPTEQLMHLFNGKNAITEAELLVHKDSILGDHPNHIELSDGWYCKKLNFYDCDWKVLFKGAKK